MSISLCRAPSARPPPASALPTDTTQKVATARNTRPFAASPRMLRTLAKTRTNRSVAFYEPEASRAWRAANDRWDDVAVTTDLLRINF